MSTNSQIDLYYWCTPNADKILILLEELQVNYHLIPINITRGSQHSTEFVAIFPNGKIPAVTIEPNGTNLNLFESGAILLHLANSHNQLLGKKPEETLQWLFWQTSNFGPMAGQNHHFNSYAPHTTPYAQQGYNKRIIAT
jgi:GST-like protein